MTIQSLDMVHDIQSSYRALIDLMANPGKISKTTPIAAKITANDSLKINSTFILLALMLLDAEVSFLLLPLEHQEEMKVLHQLTYSHPSTLSDADFIFINLDARQEHVKQVFSQAKKGTLLNPHSSATVILEVEKLDAKGDILLYGPGIRDKKKVMISNSEFWMDQRKTANENYPMGMDMILVDRCHQMMCLPRTTQIHPNEDSL